MPAENFLLLRLEMQSAAINLGALSPPGPPLRLCLASHWPGPPCLLVPSGRRDEHSGNKPRSMRPVCLSAGTSAAGPAKGARSTPPSPPASNPLAPPQPLGQGYQQYRLQQGRDDVPGLPGYQKQGLSEGITLRVKGRRRGRGVTGEPRGSPEGSSATWKTKRGQRCPHTRPLLSSREAPTSRRTYSSISLLHHPHCDRACLTQTGLRRPGPLHTTLGPSRRPREAKFNFHKTRPPLRPGELTPWSGRKGAAGDKVKVSPPGPLPSSLPQHSGHPSPTPGPPAGWRDRLLQLILRLPPAGRCGSAHGASLLEAGPLPAGGGGAWPPPWLRLLSTKLSPDLPSPVAFLLLGPRGPQPRLTQPSPSSAP